jgi:GH43 family beta-xylosidase
VSESSILMFDYVAEVLYIRTYPTSKNTGFYNTEAPSTIILPDSNGSQMINLAFATGDYQASDYNTRLMYIDASQNPLKASAWTLVTQPFLQSSSANKAYAPGSGGFFTGPDGSPWFSYGGYDRAQGQGGTKGTYPRTIRAQKCAYTSRGVLLPMVPISTPESNA